MGKWLLALAGLTIWADTYPRQPGVDVEHYAFRIALSDGTDEIRGETRVDFRARGNELSLDLAMAMIVDGVAAGLTPLAFEHRGDRLRITLPAGTERRSVTVRYHGTPAERISHRAESAWRTHVFQLELAEPGAAVAADD